MTLILANHFWKYFSQQIQRGDITCFSMAPVISSDIADILFYSLFTKICLRILN